MSSASLSFDDWLAIERTTVGFAYDPGSTRPASGR